MVSAMANGCLRSTQRLGLSRDEVLSEIDRDGWSRCCKAPETLRRARPVVSIGVVAKRVTALRKGEKVEGGGEDRC